MEDFNAKIKVLKKLVDKGYTSKALGELGIAEYIGLGLSEKEGAIFVGIQDAVKKGKLFDYLSFPKEVKEKES